MNDAAWSACSTPGVFRRRLATHGDNRGSFSELWRASWFDQLGAESGGSNMAQANVSRSDAGVLRGLHFHMRQADFWVVIEGRAFVGLVDVRATLAGGGDVSTETLDFESGDALFIPEGVAHGFYAKEPLTLVYLVTNEYDGTDELGFAWNDADARVPWPIGAPTLSARDAQNPPLRDVVAKMRSSR